MATELKKTDVVIVGLGAIGGRCPPAHAGWARGNRGRSGFLAHAARLPPDELGNNFRGWPQPAQKADSEVPTHRPNASAPIPQGCPSTR
jgi:hypothetical protein